MSVHEPDGWQFYHPALRRLCRAPRPTVVELVVMQVAVDATSPASLTLVIGALACALLGGLGESPVLIGFGGALWLVYLLLLGMRVGTLRNARLAPYRVAGVDRSQLSRSGVVVGGVADDESVTHLLIGGRRLIEVWPGSEPCQVLALVGGGIPSPFPVVAVSLGGSQGAEWTPPSTGADTRTRTG